MALKVHVNEVFCLQTLKPPLQPGQLLNENLRESVIIPHMPATPPAKEGQDAPVKVSR